MKFLLIGSLLALASNGPFSTGGHATIWNADSDKLVETAEMRMRHNADQTCRARGKRAVQKTPTRITRSSVYFAEVTATFTCLP